MKNKIPNMQNEISKLNQGSKQFILNNLMNTNEGGNLNFIDNISNDLSVYLFSKDAPYGFLENPNWSYEIRICNKGNNCQYLRLKMLRGDDYNRKTWAAKRSTEKTAGDIDDIKVIHNDISDITKITEVIKILTGYYGRVYNARYNKWHGNLLRSFFDGPFDFMAVALVRSFSEKKNYYLGNINNELKTLEHLINIELSTSHEKRLQNIMNKFMSVKERNILFDNNKFQVTLTNENAPWNIYTTPNWIYDIEIVDKSNQQLRINAKIIIQRGLESARMKYKGFHNVTKIGKDIRTVSFIIDSGEVDNGNMVVLAENILQAIGYNDITEDNKWTNNKLRKFYVILSRLFESVWGYKSHVDLE